ncbi:MAG: tetratricopeptide repeat protein, partial [Clostridia bacterium]|nr:tetratricopeptide repeat protein [Clostridia bacterium]
MAKIKTLLIYVVFPIALLVLALGRQYILMGLFIVFYFTVFVIFQYETILKILTGYNSKRERLDKAISYAFKAYKLKKSTVHTSLMFIYLLLKAAKYDKAGEIIEATEQRKMTDQEAYSLAINKALYLWKKNRINESLEIYEKLIEEGESTVLYGSYGYIISLGNDLNKALELNERAYKYNSSNKAILDNLGLIYIKLNKLEEAFDIYEELMKKSPQFPEAYYNMAELMYKMKDTDSAVRHMKNCVQMKFDGLSTITQEQAQKKLDQLMRLQGSL